MENEIKVNDYVRLKDGTIAKVIEIKNQNTDIFNWYCLDNDMGTMDRSIVKHSPNLIDLIQYGDYVNGQEVETVYGYDEDGNDKDGMGICEVEDDYAYYKYLEDINITTIVTKEMMESIIYKVKEKK